MQEFVKTVTTVNKVINGIGPNHTYMSVNPLSSGSIDLVIGAAYGEKCASIFNKTSLQELIDTLQQIHDVMVER